MRHIVLAAAFAGSLVPFAVHAGDLQSKAALAENHLNKGDHQAALSELTKAADAIRAAMPLSFAKALFVTSSDGYGLYTASNQSTFKAGDTIRLYAEPVGYGQPHTDQGYEIRMTADVEIRNTTGQILGTTENFAKFGGYSQSRRDDLSVDISIDVPALPQGSYELVVRLKDSLSGKTGEQVVPFTIDE
ncbi:hypothetical protein [Coralliovum pocilloporae]|uniref:hypothetical protein n=1 Tax=Coralliovum pocilloporae TaxID=3066369 RepID=UPI003306B401